MQPKVAGSLVIMNSVPVLAEKPLATPPCGDKLEFEEEGAQKKRSISHYYIGAYKKPTVGFEPTTTGLQNHVPHTILAQKRHISLETPVIVVTKSTEVI
jgi:hypothetical protein